MGTYCRNPAAFGNVFLERVLLDLLTGAGVVSIMELPRSCLRHA